MVRNLDQFEQLKARGYLGEEIVIGEGVALDLPAATAASRALAGAIDWIIFMVGMGISFFFFIRYANAFFLSPAVIRVALIGILALWVWLIPALTCGLTRGSSVGKFITRTRVVRADGGIITFRHAFIRATIGIFEVYMLQGVPAFIAIVFSKRGQRFGDMLADTYVVRWPKRRSFELDIPMPDSMQAWARTAHTHDVPGGLLLNIVSHFKAIPTLTDQARQQQARLLAAAAEQYVSPAPPWGTPPEDFLAALLVIRNHVEFTRSQLSRERQRRALTAVNRLPYQPAVR
ncbi:MAG: RDD family protein [Actinomycetaceae bacterium]|nr:RDD family protein [Arcanobacterium sp.]MDD7687681.1 RDD family protein [Actinomycetaceae bacterium]MDY5273928.1 RDD family protein [Arcanobacterium sp.]